MKPLKLCISCAPGRGSLLAKECKKLGYKPFDTFEQGTYINNTPQAIDHLNHHLRIGHKVYIVAFEGYIDNFDTLFDISHNYGRENIRNINKHSIRVIAHSSHSRLHSTRTIQSIIQKAIYKKLGADNGHISPVGKETQEVHYRTYRNTGLLLINTSGISLHQRGYRQQSGEAPIKESLAMSILLQTGRSHRRILRDPCCGSGTIPIEAALYASNRIPGDKRKFMYQNRENYEEIQDPKHSDTTIFNNTYYIYASDKNPEMLEIAKHNAKKAGVEHLITWGEQDIVQNPTIPTQIQKRQETIRNTTKKKYIPRHLCTNPPYGQRLQIKNIHALYTNLVTYGTSGQCTGGYICPTSMPEPRHYTDFAYSYKKKHTRNGQQECILYYRERQKL